MELLAVIKDKNKCLKAYLPGMMTPYIALSEKFSERFGDKTFLLFKSDLVFDVADEVERNVGVTEDGRIVVIVSLANLFVKHGKPSSITEATTWDTLLASYDSDALVSSYANMPYPSITSGLSGSCIRGITDAPDLKNGNVVYKYPNKSCYLDFGMNLIRPQAYTLDSHPGIEAHFGAWDYPGLMDEHAYGSILSDLIIKKDISCPVNFSNSIPIVNGLAYFPSLKDDKMYARSAVELFGHKSYDYSSVMLMDFSSFGSSTLRAIKNIKFTGFRTKSIEYTGSVYNIVVTLPNEYSIEGKTLLTWFDGRLLTFDRVKALDPTTVLITISDIEVRAMRDRDMHLVDNVQFNSAAIKLHKSNLEWVNALFVDPETQEERDAYATDAINTQRSFFTVIETSDVYINDYLLVDRLCYNSFIIAGNIGGMLQSCTGKEILDHVIVNYMDQRYLTHRTDSSKDIVYGSDAHLIGYAPYEFLSSLNNEKKYLYNLERHLVDLDDGSKAISDEYDATVVPPEKQPTSALISMPYVNRIAPDAVVEDKQLFRMLDLVKVK